MKHSKAAAAGGIVALAALGPFTGYLVWALAVRSPRHIVAAVAAYSAFIATAWLVLGRLPL